MTLAHASCPCIARMLTLTPGEFVALHAWCIGNGDWEAAAWLRQALRGAR